MCSDGERARTASQKLLRRQPPRPQLLLASAALAALIVAAPAGAMDLGGSGFSVGRFGGPLRPSSGTLSTVSHGTLPRGGIARFYGTAKIYRSGPEYEEGWRRLVQPEKDRDPNKAGYAVLIAIERAEDLDGAPLTLD